MPEENSFSDKRAHFRTPVKIDVSFHQLEDRAKLKSIKDMGALVKKTHTLDSSLGGMYIVSDDPMKKGDILSLKIVLPNQSVALTAFAEVAWTGSAGAGLHFLAVKEQDVEMLDTFLKSIPSQ